MCCRHMFYVANIRLVFIIGKFANYKIFFINDLSLFLGLNVACFWFY